MRELKFRAFYPEREIKMVYFTFLEALKNIVNFGEYERKECMEFTSIMRYTGRRDENMKEVYEKDIVKVWVYDEEGRVFELLGIFEVFYDDELCMFSIKNEEENWTPNPLGAFKQIEVIGNVFENKDLLDKQE